MTTFLTAKGLRRLGVNITHVNWWGSKRREVWDAEAAAD